MARTPTLEELIRNGVTAELVNIHTALPSRIQSYDASKRKVNVQPLVKKKYIDGEVESLPVITNVPVAFPGGGGASMTFPLKKGNDVMTIFSERSIDNWLSTGNEIEPDDPRRHDLTDGMAIPVISSFANVKPADPNDVVIDFSGSEIRIKKNGAVIMKGGKIALGTSTVEVVDILLQTLSSLVGATAGPNPLVPTPGGALFADLAAQLTQLKTTIT